MVIHNKNLLLEKLTGVHSSKRSYYVALKKKMFEMTKRNIQLEIINQLAKGIGIDMTLKEIIKNIAPKLRQLFNFNTLSLYVIDKDMEIEQVVYVTECGSSDAVTAGGLQDHNGAIKPEAANSLKEVLREGKPLYRRAPDGKPEKPVEGTPAPVVQVLVPLMAKGTVSGVLEVCCWEGITENDWMFFEQVADQLAVCLENVRLYNALLQNKREWEVTFSAVTDLLVFINRDWEIRRVNKAAMDFFALPERDILGKKCYHLFYGRESRCNPCVAEQVMRSRKTSYQQTRTRYNRVLDIFIYPACTGTDKEPYGITYYAKDVTSFVDSIKFVSMGEMSAGVAHELNSPLTAIVGDSQLLLRETDPAGPHYQLIKDIQTSGIRCQRIIQDLLTFSRQDEYTFERVDLNRIIASALSLLAYQIEKNKIVLEVDLCSEQPQLLGSAHGLEQIMINLLLNAKHAVEEKERTGGHAFSGKITIKTRIRQDNRMVIVRVGDNGCGIAPEHIPHIFNPFYTTKRIGEGTGLGLSVSLGIVQSHGGLIDVESAAGEGSTFSLILPLDAPEGCNSLSTASER